ncbi:MULTISPECIES: NAD(P)-binding domain-containing protein [Micromonospora]|nr:MULTISPECIES: NAD(P)-binding domain-containing protein [Micromonospora]NES16820.1 NAD(P)-dependent oxidoreductase [Micromonospora sp. PPF5-17B]NES37838.1 NAD(P)-dependent oxidoreductase [Micromonospora solifontis]NES58542.1 NAD(P)-dependent oxidoreductase [Micromonospora sp. PPF5-6]
MADNMRLRVAFLGLGRMGTPMARHVLRAGHDLTVWNRTRGKADALAGEGARVAETAAAAAAGRDVVVLMLADPDAVEQVLLGPDGVASGADPDTLSTRRPWWPRGAACGSPWSPRCSCCHPGNGPS